MPAHISKTHAILSLLSHRMGPAKEFHVTANHDTGERSVVVRHADGKLSMIVQARDVTVTPERK